MKTQEYTALLRRREVLMATISGNASDTALVEKCRAEIAQIDERSKRHTRGEPDEIGAAPAAKRKSRGKKS